MKAEKIINMCRGIGAILCAATCSRAFTEWQKSEVAGFCVFFFMLWVSLLIFYVCAYWREEK